MAHARLRDEGLHWALRADIHDCLPHIDLRRARQLRAVLVADRSCSPCWICCRGAQRSVPIVRTVAGFPTVRYSDDVVAAAGGRQDVWEAARVALAAVEEIGMTLGADKIEIMSFNGFRFLGEDFGPHDPPEHDNPVRAENVVRAGQQGHIVSGGGRA